MASLINCPHCGIRPTQEFAIRSDAALKRPAAGAETSEWVDYVYFRDNPKGRHREHWHHAGGCRRWLIVERDTVTHAVYGVTDASLGGAA